MHTLHTSRRVEFADTDMAGIAHFSRFFVFLESAEHEFLRAVGTSVHTRVGDDDIGWPRVRASLDFLRPVRFEDVLDIRLWVRRKGRRSLTWGVEFSCKEEPVARGELVTACCRLRPGLAPEAIAIPAGIAELLEEAPDSPESPGSRERAPSVVAGAATGETSA